MNITSSEIVAQIKANIASISSSLPDGVRLVAVSKYNPIENVCAAYEAGQRMFGESHAQELVPKAQAMPNDVRWHFIGHLQTNKVKYIAPYVDVVESVDSLKLLREIDKQAAKCGRVIKCLLQFHVAAEETKFGFDEDECMAMLGSAEFRELRNVSIIGVMGMATATDDESQVRAEFARVASIYARLKKGFFADDAAFCEISMGMTHDYPIAIEEGATLVRVGSGIFGERMYM